VSLVPTTKLIILQRGAKSLFRSREVFAKEAIQELEQIEQSKEIIEFNSLQTKLLKIKIFTLLTEFDQAQELVTEVFGAGQRLDSEIICKKIDHRSEHMGIDLIQFYERLKDYPRSYLTPAEQDAFDQVLVAGIIFTLLNTLYHLKQEFEVQLVSE